MRRTWLLPLLLIASPAAAQDSGLRFDQPGCVAVSALRGWHPVRFAQAVTRIERITGGWSVDIRSYPPVGPEGHVGKDGEALAVWTDLKYETSLPFARLLLRDPQGGKPVGIALAQPLPEPMTDLELRINDQDVAMGDNSGELCVCFHPPQPAEPAAPCIMPAVN